MSDKKGTAAKVVANIQGQDVLKQILFGDVYAKLSEFEKRIDSLSLEINSISEKLDELEDSIEDKVDKAIENDLDDKIREIAEEVVNSADISISVY